MQNQTHFLEAGLKDPSSFSSKEEYLCKLSHIMISNITTNSDDYIGNESCIDLQNENDMVDLCETPNTNYDNKSKKSCKKNEKRVFPPTMPLLARTENLACHMPWVLKRYYTSEGRLILKEEKVKYHEYFRAHRENGRLTLQLVPHDDHDEDEDVDEDEDEDEDEFFGSSEVEASAPNSASHEDYITTNGFSDVEENKSSNIVVGGEFLDTRSEVVGAASSPNEGIHDNTIFITNTNRFVEEEDRANIPVESDNVGGGGNGGLNCLNCSSVKSAPSGFVPSCVGEV
ncbi:unnamed protein product [Lupinus luteus]|uniref:FAF domain-containing protein n=1 Tax=Lupinus luteus TaxID=3873 RepID=A0AAV1X8E3_LUPLU